LIQLVFDISISHAFTFQYTEDWGGQNTRWFRRKCQYFGR